MRRIVTWSLLVAVTIALVVLGFSDRAPDAVESIARPVEDAAIGVARSFGLESPAWWDTIRDSPDVVFHVLQWTAVAAVLVVLADGRVPAVALFGGLVATSSAIEVLQMRLSATREFERGDLLGNLLGISLGTLFGVALLAALHVWRHRRRPVAT